MSSGKSVIYCLLAILLLLQQVSTAVSANHDLVLNFESEIGRLNEIPEAPAVIELDRRELLMPNCQFLEVYLARGRAIGRKVACDEQSRPLACESLDDNWFSNTMLRPIASVAQQLGNLAREAETCLFAANQAIVKQWSEQLCREITECVSGLFSGDSEDTTPVSIEPAVEDDNGQSPTGETTDEYWQYYEDCDQWNVTFVYQTLSASGMICVLADGLPGIPSYGAVSQLVQGIVSKNLLMVVASSHQLFQSLSGMISEQIRRAEFRLVESELNTLEIAETRPAGNVIAEWICLNAMLKLRGQTFFSSLQDNIQAATDRLKEVWMIQLSPIMYRCKLEESRYIAERKLRQCREQQSLANGLSCCGERLLEISRQLLDRMDNRECMLVEELESIREAQSQFRLAQRKPNLDVKQP